MNCMINKIVAVQGNHPLKLNPKFQIALDFQKKHQL